MKTKLLAVLLIVLALSTTACGAVNSLVNGGKSSGTVANLWSDVPPLDGAQKANIDMPLAARLMMQTMIKGMSQNGANMDFIAFTTTKTPADVQNFYTKDRMIAAGWSDQNALGCTGDASGGAANAGTLCLFDKKEGSNDVGLAIVVALDDQTKQTQVFYVRFTATATPAPKQ